MTTTSKYPTKDHRRFFEKRCQSYDWEKMFSIIAAVAKEFSGQDAEDPTIKMAMRIGLGPFIRYSTDFCGELNGYLATAGALKAYNKIGRINPYKKTNEPVGPHFMEHLIPVSQFTQEIIANPTIENIRKMFKKQRIVYVLRTEQKKYDVGDFKKKRSDKDIKAFKATYGITDLPDTPEKQ